MSLRAMVARRYCRHFHTAGHICEMGRTAADIAAAACVEWLESPAVVELVREHTDVLALLVKTIQEED